MLDLNSIHFRTLARMQTSLTDVTNATSRIEDVHVRTYQPVVEQHALSLSNHVFQRVGEQEVGNHTPFLEEKSINILSRQITLVAKCTSTMALVRRCGNDQALFWDEGQHCPREKLARKFGRFSIPSTYFRRWDSALYLLTLCISRQGSAWNSFLANPSELLMIAHLIERFLLQPLPEMQYATPELYEAAVTDLPALEELRNDCISSKRLGNRAPLGTHKVSPDAWLSQGNTYQLWVVNFLDRSLAMSPSWRLAQHLQNKSLGLRDPSTSTPVIDTGFPMLAFKFLAGILKAFLSIPELPLAKGDLPPVASTLHRVIYYDARNGFNFIRSRLKGGVIPLCFYLLQNGRSLLHVGPPCAIDSDQRSRSLRSS